MKKIHSCRKRYALHKKITALGGASLDLLGCIKDVKIHNKNSEILSTLYVLRNGVYEHPLLSERSLLKLGMIKYNEEGEFLKRTVLQLSDSSPEILLNNDCEKRKLQMILADHNCLFNGIGKLSKRYSVPPQGQSKGKNRLFCRKRYNDLD